MGRDKYSGRSHMPSDPPTSWFGGWQSVAALRFWNIAMETLILALQPMDDKMISMISCIRHQRQFRQLGDPSSGSIKIILLVDQTSINSRRTQHHCSIQYLNLMTAGGRQVWIYINIISSSLASEPDQLPSSLLDVLIGWECTWIWKSLQLIGDDNWPEESIAAGTCMAVAYGS